MRHAALRLISDWPSSIPFDLAALGGRTLVMQLLTLAAAEFLSSGAYRYLVMCLIVFPYVR